MASTDDIIVRRRLLIDGEGSGDNRKIQTLLKTFLKWFHFEGNEDERDHLYNKMMILLVQCDFNICKTLQVFEMNQVEMKNYMDLYENIGESIKSANDQIKECKRDLDEAKTVRKNRQEYDALAKVISKQPNRKETSSEINVLEKELQTLTETQQTLTTKLELRKKQLHLLVHTIHELQEMLEDDPGGIKEAKDISVVADDSIDMDVS
ncbi:THO complex subunit 7 homolog [Xenia sp. Carnegie-2017]|uniref:THO complex subunit 7 homolog n=1 Tax=Xenia sp. Carnegie-2017 TaxID=2897299 RepID=UPI001F0411A9|nr:THO complex subunit 7 homolog [Xenia sp. Carnegie-2017]